MTQNGHAGMPSFERGKPVETCILLPIERVHGTLIPLQATRDFLRDH